MDIYIYIWIYIYICNIILSTFCGVHLNRGGIAPIFSPSLVKTMMKNSGKEKPWYHHEMI